LGFAAPDLAARKVGKTIWRADPGFLVGAGGVALALASATTGLPADWDRALLLS
jgi:hypothetical protein